MVVEGIHEDIRENMSSGHCQLREVEPVTRVSNLYCRWINSQYIYVREVVALQVWLHFEEVMQDGSTR